MTNSEKIRNGLSRPEIRFWLAIVVLVASVVGTVVTLRTRQEYIVMALDLQRVEIAGLRGDVSELQQQIARIETMVETRIVQEQFVDDHH